MSPERAFHDLVSALNSLHHNVTLVPDALMCTVAPRPQSAQWIVSISIRPKPLALVATSVLPMHFDPGSEMAERILQRTCELNRMPMPVTFFFDPFGTTVGFRQWLPLNPIRPDSVAEWTSQMLETSRKVAASVMPLLCPGTAVCNPAPGPDSAAADDATPPIPPQWAWRYAPPPADDLSDDDIPF